MNERGSYGLKKTLILVGVSLVCIACPAYFLIPYWVQGQIKASPITLHKMVLTGPQKEGLKASFFAEVLHLSVDKPTKASELDTKKAKEELCKHPVIEKAEIELLEEDTLFIEYTMRKPMARLGDFENLAFDRLGYIFPLKPYFSPKNIPSVYFGDLVFDAEKIDPIKPQVSWNKPLQGSLFELAFNLLELIYSEPLRRLMEVRTIDVSQAFADSLGKREIVLEVEETIPVKQGKKNFTVIEKRFLRLSAKNYAKDLGNYLKLRKKLATEYATKIKEGRVDLLSPKTTIIDLRIEKMAFIKEQQ